MGHYDSQREEHDAEQKRAYLKRNRPTIELRLQLLAGALRTLGLNGAGIIEEAIEHLRESK